MKNIINIIGFAVLMAIIVFSAAAQTSGDGWNIAYWGINIDDTSTATLDYSTADDGVVTVTVGGRAEPHNERDGWNKWKASVWCNSLSLVNANTRYTYVLEMWTESGTRDIWFQYYVDNHNQIYLGENIHLTNRRTTFTITGQPIPDDRLIHRLFFQCGDQLGTFYVRIIEIREATPEEIARAGWNKFVADDTTATLDYSVARDGVVTVDIGGDVESRSEAWKAQVQYQYTAKANTRYTYVFEAWTQRNTRDLTIGHFYNNDTQTGSYENITLTNRRQTFTSTGQAIPRDGTFHFELHLANQVGRIFVRMIEIREATPEEIARTETRTRWGKHIADDSTATLDFSVADDGVVTVNVGGRIMPSEEWKTLLYYQYEAKENTSYTYVFEAWTQRGTRNLRFDYYDDYANQVCLGNTVTLTNRRQIFIITGQAIPKGDITRINFYCADQLGTFYLRMIEIREATPEDITRSNWSKWVADDSTATLDFSVANDGVVTVNIGGRAAPRSENWKANINYQYTMKANTRYTYVFEAWTDRGNRDAHFQYYNNGEDQVYLGEDITITNRRTTYTITGQPIPKDRIDLLYFFSAHQLGTFYLRMIEIREATPEDITRSNWGKWVADDSTATLDFSVANDGVVTVNIGGRADPVAWKAQAQYQYTTKANTRYTYVFEAWTQRGTRNLGIAHFHNGSFDRITITNRRTTYTLTGEAIPRDGTETLNFHAADQTGTFYLRMIEIREN